MPASISTRLDELEFLELADSYYVTEMTDNPSRSGSTITLSTHFRRRATTPGPRWRPSTLIECEDFGPASGEVDELYKCDFVKGRTSSHILRGLRTPSSISLESYSDSSQSFQTADDHESGKPTTVPPEIQISPIDRAIQPSFSIPTKISRPISTASFVSESCFSILWFPRWRNLKGQSWDRAGFRSTKEKKLQSTCAIHPEIGEGSGLDYNSSQSCGEYFVPLPSRGLPNASSPFIDLDYDYHLAVEVLINGSNVMVDPKSSRN